MAFVRQQDLVDLKKLGSLSVAVIGCGAVGSFTSFILTKMGIKKLSIWDDDQVQLHNLASQFFPRESIGLSKVKAVSAECLRHAPEDILIDINEQRYEGQPLDHDIIIATPDDIEGRAAAFKQAKKNFATVLYIDGRMSAEMVRVFAFNPKSYEHQQKYFTDYIDGVANSVEPCTAKAISYNANYAGSLIASHVKKFVTGEPIPFEFSFMFKEMCQVKGQ